MLIYEKDNKLNINFNPSLLEVGGGNPDIQIGENEIKLGDTEITSENVLPIPTSEDVGKVPTVQEGGAYGLENIPSELPVATPEDAGKVVSVDENGEYELANAGNGVLIVTEAANALDKTMKEITTAFNTGIPVYRQDEQGTKYSLYAIIEVHFSARGNIYVGSVIFSNGLTDVRLKTFDVTGNTEAEALNSFPSAQTT